MPADTTSVPMLMAKVRVTIVVGENETLTTTRKAAASPRASHERKRGMMMLLLVCGVRGIARPTERRAASEGVAHPVVPHSAARGSSRDICAAAASSVSSAARYEGEGRYTRVDIGPAEVLPAQRDDA